MIFVGKCSSVSHMELPEKTVSEGFPGTEVPVVRVKR